MSRHQTLRGSHAAEVQGDLEKPLQTLMLVGDHVINQDLFYLDWLIPLLRQRPAAGAG